MFSTKDVKEPVPMTAGLLVAGDSGEAWPRSVTVGSAMPIKSNTTIAIGSRDTGSPGSEGVSAAAIMRRAGEHVNWRASLPPRSAASPTQGAGVWGGRG